VQIFQYFSLPNIFVVNFKVRANHENSFYGHNTWQQLLKKCNQFEYSPVIQGCHIYKNITNGKCYLAFTNYNVASIAR